VIASHYLAKFVKVTMVQQKLYATFIVVVMTIVKMMGRAVLEQLSTILAILALTPSVIYMATALHETDFHYLAETKVPPDRILIFASSGRACEYMTAGAC
jgi:purine-cytosine permease-like protein